MTYRRALAAACLLGSALSAPARAQSDAPSHTLPIERYRPAMDSSGLGSTEGGQVPTHLGWELGLLFGYALNPLVLRDASGAVVAPIVAHRLGANLTFSLGLFDYLSLGVELPMTLVQLGGSLPSDVGEAVGVADGIATIGVGDVKLVPKVQLLREQEHQVSLAILAALTLPTAGGLNVDTGSYHYGGGFLGEGPGKLAFLPEAALSTNLVGVRVAGNLGYRLRQPSSYLGALEISPELVYRIGAGYDLGAVAPALGQALLFAELFGATADNNPFGLLSQRGLSEDEQRLDDIERRLANPLEWAAGLRYRTPLAGLHLEGGIGAGILPGFGSPDLRAFLGVRLVAERHDRDADGVDDGDDRCLKLPEDLDGHDDADGCPDLDNDGDGLPDLVDRCPDLPEDIDGFMDGDGCPEPDNDEDGIADHDDRCPRRSGTAALQGCPAFNDSTKTGSR